MDSYWGGWDGGLPSTRSHCRFACCWKIPPGPIGILGGKYDLVATITSTQRTMAKFTRDIQQCCVVMTSQFLMTGHSHNWVMTSHDRSHD